MSWVVTRTIAFSMQTTPPGGRLTQYLCGSYDAVHKLLHGARPDVGHVWWAKSLFEAGAALIVWATPEGAVAEYLRREDAHSWSVVPQDIYGVMEVDRHPVLP